LSSSAASRFRLTDAFILLTSLPRFDSTVFCVCLCSGHAWFYHFPRHVCLWAISAISQDRASPQSTAHSPSKCDPSLAALFPRV
jgi:hypothetical protein